MGRESQLVGTWLVTHPGHCCAQGDARKGISDHWKSLSAKRQGITITQLLLNRHLLQLGRCQSFSRATQWERCLVFRDQALKMLH